MRAAAPERRPAPEPPVAVAPEGSEVSSRQRSVCELFQDQVRARGDRPALHTKIGGTWRPISWKQYGEAVKRAGGYLLSEGLAKGQRTAILSYNRPEWYIADLAPLHARAV